jgi:3-hydroxyanthranilate 3,4-dioxygenase
MQSLTPFNLRQWIDEHRSELRPPVCNKQVFEQGEFIIMVVGGPNARQDYHDDPGEEFFYQLEGEVLLLPAHVPHSPQRFADTVGLVVERKRRAGEADGFLWYCDRCDARLYSEYLQLTDIETQLPPVFERFWSNPEHTVCRACGSSLRK